MENLNIDNNKQVPDQSKNSLAIKLIEFRENITNCQMCSIIKTASELCNLLRESLFYKLDTFPQNIPKIHEITDALLNSVEIVKMDQEILEEYLFILEKIFYLFIFHFNMNIVNLSLKVLIFLLNEIDFEFHKETLQKIIKIIHLLKLKKTVNPTVCNKMISNFSLALHLILHNTNQDTKKCFYDFVFSNSEDFILIWILCYNCTNEMNFSKFYQVESISLLIEKYIKELEKSTKIMETALQNFKSDQSLTVKNRIKQLFDIFGMCSKIIDAFNIRGNKSYNFDKIIKTNLIPLMRRFWNMILFVNETQIYEIDFAVESIQSIILLCDSIDCMKFDILLPLLNWFGMLLEKNAKYIVNLFFIVKLMSKTSLPEETSTEIAGAVFEILEKIFSNVTTSMNKDKDAVFKYYIVMILDSLEKFPNYCISIKEDFNYCKEFYSSIKEGKFVEEKISLTKKNFDVFTKEYKEVVLNSINYERNFISTNNNPEDKSNKFSQLQNSLNKYEEFKTSLKTLYNLNNRNLTIDNKINNFIEKETKGERKDLSNIDTYENFYLETSIEMFREIFRYQK